MNREGVTDGKGVVLAKKERKNTDKKRTDEPRPLVCVGGAFGGTTMDNRFVEACLGCLSRAGTKKVNLHERSCIQFRGCCRRCFVSVFSATFVGSHGTTIPLCLLCAT